MSIGGGMSWVVGALSVPVPDGAVSDFITGLFSVGGAYLGLAVGAGVMIVILRRLMPWLRLALGAGGERARSEYEDAPAWNEEWDGWSDDDEAGHFYRNEIRGKRDY